MREFIFLGLLAYVHGLGDTFPFLNSQDQSYSAADQAASAVTLWNGDHCNVGTKQSPINVISYDAIPKSHPHLIHGYDYDAIVNWLIDGRSSPSDSVTTVNFNPTPPLKLLSGGPLPTGER